MSILNIYILCHLALLAASAISGLWRLKRRDPLVYWANDLLYVMFAFMLAGGAVLGLARIAA